MRNDKFYRFRDEYLTFRKGYDDFYETSRDGTKFFVDLRDLGSLFYMSDDETEQHFFIEHPNKILEQRLNSYFLGRHSRMNMDLYSPYHGLTHFFGSILESSAMFGEVFHYIKWDQRQFDNTEYVLPLSFDYINPETMRIVSKRKSTIAFQQKYSWYGRLQHRQDEEPIRTVNFEAWEIFHTSYPFGGQRSPVQVSMKLLKPVSDFMKFMLLSAEGQTYTKPRSLAVERARGKTFEAEKRKQDLARAETRTNFHLIMNIDGVMLTRYYDFFTVARYKSDKYKALSYYVKQFNEQILKPLAEKNSWKHAPILKIQGLITDDEAWEHFNAWSDGTLSDDTFIQNVARAD